eukprot:6450557-Amphidinium_carterae.1
MIASSLCVANCTNSIVNAVLEKIRSQNGPFASCWHVHQHLHMHCIKALKENTANAITKAHVKSGKT